MTDLELDGRTFVFTETIPIAQSPHIKNEPKIPTLTLKDDDIFLVTDTLGNIPKCLPGQERNTLGLFCRDTRFLNLLELQIEGQSSILLSSNTNRGKALSAFCANPYLKDRGIEAETIGIEREIVLNGGLFEELTITNYRTDPVSFELSLSFDADFVDLFEIRDRVRPERGKLLCLVAENPEVPEEIAIAYQGLDGAIMESRIQFVERQPDRYQDNTAVWQLELKSHQTIRLGYRLQLLMNCRSISQVETPMTLVEAKVAESQELEQWQQQVTKIRSDSSTFNRLLERGERDIYLLRQSFGNKQALSAGIPWFSTLFGRDAIIAAWQTLILDPNIARDTLAILAEYQGKTEDNWREESPGKILHELRLGEMARCGEIPHTPYYGTVDATPLWLILYAEYYTWTGDRNTIEQLWENALQAMDWVDRNCRATGYLSYQRISSGGLINQGWKDSEECIVDGKGKLATGAIALCEVQGYVYGAKMRLAAIAKLRQQFDLAQQWERDAGELKSRFNRDFWLADLDYCALALDGAGKPVDSITSNPGHCLAMDILQPEKAASVAARLHAPDMFNGWGIRTLSSASPAYNPMGYHIGSIWPHDNSIIALGLRSLDLVEQTQEMTQGIFDMTLQQPYNCPPELFCGNERTAENSPVRYPVACSPQAWATGALFQLLQVAINIVPDAASNCVRIIHPVLPESLDRLTIENLRIGSTAIDLEFQRSKGTTSCRVAKRGNLKVLFEA
jgi:glycogen debranching enzyme